MKRFLRTLFISVCLLPVTTFGATCTAPALVNDFITTLEGDILAYQREINATGNQCNALVARDASYDEVVETQAQNFFNTAQGEIIDFLGDIAQPQDFLDDFLQAIPFLDRPYALNYDLDRVQERMDRYWNLQIRAHKLCQFDRSEVMRQQFAKHFETQRQLRGAMQPLYQGQPNPFYIGFAAESPEYTLYRSTGYYNHPSQRACSDEELNLEQIAKKLQRISDTFSSAAKEVEHEFKRSTNGVHSAWTEIDRRANEINGNVQKFFTEQQTTTPKKTVSDILSDIQEAETTPVSARSLLEANLRYQEQYKNHANISRIRSEVATIYTSNAHLSLRLQEAELDNIVRMLLAIDGILEKNVASVQNVCGQQATDIPCPSPQ